MRKRTGGNRKRGARRGNKKKKERGEEGLL